MQTMRDQTLSEHQLEEQATIMKQYLLKLKRLWFFAHSQKF